jgi:hypothetical protein
VKKMIPMTMETKMKLINLFESDFGDNAQKTTDDDLTKRRLDDTRKPKITLSKLNKLRKLRELKRFQELKRDSLINIMYGPDSGGGGPAF